MHEIKTHAFYQNNDWQKLKEFKKKKSQSKELSNKKKRGGKWQGQLKKERRMEGRE